MIFAHDLLKGKHRVLWGGLVCKRGIMPSVKVKLALELVLPLSLPHLIYPPPLVYTRHCATSGMEPPPRSYRSMKKELYVVSTGASREEGKGLRAPLQGWGGRG